MFSIYLHRILAHMTQTHDTTNISEYLRRKKDVHVLKRRLL